MAQQWNIYIVYVSWAGSLVVTYTRIILTGVPGFQDEATDSRNRNSPKIRQCDVPQHLIQGSHISNDGG